MNKNTHLTEGNIFRSLIMFALPVMFALFLQAMYGAVDLLIVGQFADTTDVSGVATGSMLMQTVTMVITGLSMGITIMVGQETGRKDAKMAGRIIGGGICLFTAIALVMSLVMTIGSDMFSELMRAPESAFEATSSYIKISALGSIFIVAYNLLGSIFRGLGDSKTPLITVAIACVVNIIGDLLLVAMFKMGAGGAAIATVAAQGISVWISCLIIRKKELPFEFSLKSIIFDKKIVGKILRLGVPVALQELLVGISFLVIQVIVNTMGVTASAGVGIAEKVCMFLMLVASAYMQSMSAFVAQNIGAGRPERANCALWYGILSAFAAGVVMGYIAFFHGNILSAVFSNDAKVISASHSYLKAYAVDCMFTASLFCFVGYFNGHEKTMFVMLQGIIGAFCVRIPVAYLMSMRQGVSLFEIGLATPASTVVQIVLCVGMFVYMMKKAKNLSI